MFIPMDGSAPTRRARGNESQTRWDYIKTFYYDPVKWSFIKSIGLFGVAIYLIRDLANNDMLPME